MRINGSQNIQPIKNKSHQEDEQNYSSRQSSKEIESKRREADRLRRMARQCKDYEQAEAYINMADEIERNLLG